MGAYLLDTDHLSYLQERHPNVVNRLARLSPADQVPTSVINIGELLRGVYQLPKSRRQRELLLWYHQAVRRMDAILPVTQAAAECFAEVDTALRRKGKPIPTNDIWVAAVATVKGAVLVTNDGHFAQVDRLKVENWTL